MLRDEVHGEAGGGRDLLATEREGNPGGVLRLRCRAQRERERGRDQKFEGKVSQRQSPII